MQHSDQNAAPQGATAVSCLVNTQAMLVCLCNLHVYNTSLDAETPLHLLSDNASSPAAYPVETS